MINKGLFTSNSGEWETPQGLFNELDKEFHFDLDPCATKENAKCNMYYTKEEDGLKQDWNIVDLGIRFEVKSVFMNPPYGREIGRWVEKAHKESRRSASRTYGATVVCLLPARTDTKWYHDYCIKGEIRYIKGRLKFSGMKNSAPFPSMIVIFRGQNAP